TEEQARPDDREIGSSGDRVIEKAGSSSRRAAQSILTHTPWEIVAVDFDARPLTSFAASLVTLGPWPARCRLRISRGQKRRFAPASMLVPGIPTHASPPASHFQRGQTGETCLNFQGWSAVPPIPCPANPKPGAIVSLGSQRPLPITRVHRFGDERLPKGTR